MTSFDKICAVVSIPIGGLLMVLGVFGIFVGSSANFTLPPIIGGLPFLVGWSACVTMLRYWRRSSGNGGSVNLGFAKDLYPQYSYQAFLAERPDMIGHPGADGTFKEWLRVQLR
ncbi:MAG: hypothetical protein QM755_20125 [Luteolibacter sp.]